MKNIIHKITRLLNKFNDNKINTRIIEERVGEIIKEFKEEFKKEILNEIRKKEIK
jgi:hypothetical protein